MCSTFPENLSVLVFAGKEVPLTPFHSHIVCKHAAFRQALSRERDIMNFLRNINFNIRKCMASSLALAQQFWEMSNPSTPGLIFNTLKRSQIHSHSPWLYIKFSLDLYLVCVCSV